MEHLSDSTIEGLAEGSLTNTNVQGALQHLDACPSCHRAFAIVALDQPALGGPDSEATSLRPGQKVGRYVLLEQAGTGAMGKVFAAYDPQLDRRVALKLLRSEVFARPDGAAAQERLMREARAMARLSDPNVIAIHDVGMIGDQLFIAMEYIEGSNLKEWLTETPRPWREALAAVRRAGRGLAAAHRAGLVHRDFKPDNILVDEEGGVHVTDFGLAQTPTSTLKPLAVDAWPPPSPIEGNAWLQQSLTRTGELLGTPAYMAPEQHRAQVADARTDQFAFCVTLYESLYGERPFAGDTLFELQRAVATGSVRPPSPGRDVPGWLRRILLQGLATEPERRFESMDELLHALDRGTRRRRARAVVAVVTLAIMGVVATTLSLAQKKSLLCTGAELNLKGVWDAPTQAAIHQAFLKTQVPFAEDAWKGVSQQLSLYANAWTRMHQSACAATRIRGEQSDLVLGLRMDCLDRRIEDLSALTHSFSHLDDRMLAKAFAATQGLTSVDVCADVQSLSNAEKLPEEPARRARALALQKRIAEVRAMYLTDQLKTGEAKAHALVQDAKELDYAPLKADALLAESRFQASRQDNAAASEDLYQAVLAAQAGRHSRALVASLTDLSIIDKRLAKLESARHWVDQANATLKSLGRADLVLEGRVLRSDAALQQEEGHSKEAKALGLRALALAETEKGVDGLAAAETNSLLGTLGVDENDGPEAQRYTKRALEILQGLLGPVHPKVAFARNNYGNALVVGSRYAEALTQFHEAVRIWELNYGKEHPGLASILGNLGLALYSSQHLTEAEAVFERVIHIAEAHPTVGKMILAQAIENQGRNEILLKQFGKADAHLNQASAMVLQLYGRKDPHLALILAELGDLAAAQKHHAVAFVQYRQARALFVQIFGAEHVHVAEMDSQLGSLELERKNPSRALPSLERAYKFYQSHWGSPEDLSDLELNLARALWDTSTDRVRSARLVQSARARLDDQSDGTHARRAALDAWRSAHVAAM